MPNQCVILAELYMELQQNNNNNDDVGNLVLLSSLPQNCAASTKNDNDAQVTCCNPNLGFVTKTRACKVAGQEEARESHLMFPGV
jgi:hypothetical protein